MSRFTAILLLAALGMSAAAGRVIVDDPVHVPTLEGPKLYKRDGYCYIFAPFGGVDHGSEAVLRSRNILRAVRIPHGAFPGRDAGPGPAPGARSGL
jgi:hypothetical protein